MEQNTIFHNRYELKRLLGRGQFSEVWLAEDNSTKVEVALKIYAPGTGMDDDGAQMLAREFALVVNAIHENLLRPIFFDICDRKPYLVQHNKKKGSCKSLIGKMNEDEAWQFIHDVAAGLAFLHAYEPDPIIHQDIKPDNIMIGPTGHYMITDFGVSTHSRSALRKSVGMQYASAGTIAYMGPERFSKDKTPIKASDVYSLGATVFELITGDAPFGERGGLLQASGDSIPDIKGDFSNELKYAIRSCLHFNPWDRPTAEKLMHWAESRRPDGIEIQQESKKHGKPWIIPSCIAVVLVAIAVVIGMLVSGGNSGESAEDANYPQYQELVNSCQQQIVSGEIDKAKQTLDIIKVMDNQYNNDIRYNNYDKLNKQIEDASKAEEQEMPAIVDQKTKKK